MVTSKRNKTQEGAGFTTRSHADRKTVFLSPIAARSPDAPGNEPIHDWGAPVASQCFGGIAVPFKPDSRLRRAAGLVGRKVLQNGHEKQRQERQEWARRK